MDLNGDSDLNLNSYCYNALPESVLATLRSLLGQELGQKPFSLITLKNQKSLNGFVDVEANELSACSEKSISVFDDKSIMGSPLKLQAIANLSSSPETSTPIPYSIKIRKNTFDLGSKLSLRDAKLLLSKFKKKKEASVPLIIVLCDGEDSRKTILTGIHKEIVEGKMFVKTFKVMCSRIKQSSIDEVYDKKGKNYQMTSQYKILDRQDGLGSLCLEVKWSDNTGSMKLTKLQSAVFNLQVNVVPGSEQSSVFYHHCQLKKVEGIVEGLRTGELPEVLSTKTVDAVKLLRDFFNNIKLGMTEALSRHDKHTCISGMLSGTAKRLNLEPSSDKDFSDSLWEIISLCSDYKQIVDCLNLTFCELRKGELKVFIHRDNQTTIAKLVRQSYSGIASFPPLSGSLILQLVAEIGMEKIRKDYASIFLNNNLCTSVQWQSFYETLSRQRYEIVNMEELNSHLLTVQYDILSKLHHCLEILTLIDSFTENQDLTGFANTVLNTYKTCDLDTSRTFTFPITALQANPEMKKVPVSFFRRESVVRNVSTVDCCMADVPDGFGLSASLSSSVSSLNGSSFFGDSREFVYFKTEENLICFGES
ncbi:protein zwilch homolog isoform X2 [Physella acuta]|nr:protein zwilch homolog isoform X2 [Physella acuta]